MGYDRAIDLSEGQGHIPNMEGHVLLKVKVGHLTTLSPDTVSSILISTLHEAISNPCQPRSGLLYFKNFTKSKKKMCWKSRETVSSLGTGEEILLNC